MSPKDWLAEVLYRAGVTDRLIRISTDQLIVFGYHRIRPDGEDFETPFDEGAFGPTVGCFREQLCWLKDHTTILSEADLIDFARSGRPWPRPSSFVTFDDGYRDQYTRALPVLEELKIPATFFIPTHLIESRRLGWWDSIAYLIRKTHKKSIWIDGKEHVLGKKGDEAICCLQESMKLRRETETREMLAKLSEACEVSLPSAEAQDAELMSWDEIRYACARGVAVGSHSHTHRVLRTLGPGAVAEELRISKATLEAETGRDVRTLAYPCGGYQHFDWRTQELASEAGYVLAFSFNTGINRSMNLAPFDVRRVGAPEGLGRFAAITCLPWFFALSSPNYSDAA